ncbi:MAG: hypothetical protein LBV50_07505 [Novosphingobium sp.]|jgi:hypothetical protein|nr:hypothetical protein [Novosphingobium sp.]
MAVMSGNLYHALKSVGVEDSLAQKAAEEVASYDNRFARIEADLAIVKWMPGVVLAGVVALIMKAFF